MNLKQNDREHIKDMMDRGIWTPDQANVEKVRMQRVLIVAKLPREVRNALNTAVKAGYLGHKKKDGYRPEVYYHPDFEYLANARRNEIAADCLRAVAKVLAPPDSWRPE